MKRRKHYLNHTKHILCDFPTCPRGIPGKGLATNQDLYKHAWVAHPAHAEKKGFPHPGVKCERCGVVLRRKNNLKRHLEKSCKGKQASE